MRNKMKNKAKINESFNIIVFTYLTHIFKLNWFFNSNIPFCGRGKNEKKKEKKTSYSSPFPPRGARLLLTANILAVTPAANPSTCLAYCSTCLLFNKTSNRLGSCGNLNKRVHSSSGKGGCLASTREAFSALRFCCQAVILACSRASCRW